MAGDALILKVGDYVQQKGSDHHEWGGPQRIRSIDPNNPMRFCVQCDDLDDEDSDSYWDWDSGRYELTTPPEPLPTDTVTHPTGAVRESKEGKGRPDLFLAGFPRAITSITKHVDCDLGRARNWEKGLPESSLVSSAFRHLLGYVSGVSEDSPEYNLTANAWNALVLLEEFLRVQEGAMDSSVMDIQKASRGT
jgi:hypothetical protein